MVPHITKGGLGAHDDAVVAVAEQRSLERKCLFAQSFELAVPGRTAEGLEFSHFSVGHLVGVRKRQVDRQDVGRSAAVAGVRAGHAVGVFLVGGECMAPHGCRVARGQPQLGVVKGVEVESGAVVDHQRRAFCVNDLARTEPFFERWHCIHGHGASVLISSSRSTRLKRMSLLAASNSPKLPKADLI